MLKIFFSDSKIYLQNESRLIDSNQLKKLEQTFDVKNLVLLHQTHSNIGKNLTSIDEIQNHEYFKGDYLITNLKNIGLVIRTADCLPIIIFDEQKKVIANIHAGWRGSVSGVVENTIRDMQKYYNSNLSDLKVYFGPCAKVCCYKVSEDFDKNLKQFTELTIFKIGNYIYFDLPKYNLLTLYQLGIDISQVYLNSNNCTICNKNYYSYRRDNKETRRQINLVVLLPS
ncbi:peptidoglycan editing factor PgeF [Candidatus Dependentiae bacterium]|nr:peptidoglycan editing factor PgeF [Candidatus Dependentiae bacterium]